MKWTKRDISATTNLYNQWQFFRERSHGIACERSLHVAKSQPAYRFWSQRGHPFPELRQLAMRLLAQQASSSASERINSEMGWIKNDKVCSCVWFFICTKLKVSLRCCFLKANSMGSKNVENVTWVHHNLRLLNKVEDAAFEEVHILWDEEVEAPSDGDD